MSISTTNYYICNDVIYNIASFLNQNDKMILYKTFIESNYEKEYFIYEYARLLRRKNAANKIKKCYLDYIKRVEDYLDRWEFYCKD